MFAKQLSTKLFIYILIGFPIVTFAQYWSVLDREAVLVGPMIHYNFNGSFTFGIEASYWNRRWETSINDFEFAQGLDIGIEMFKPKVESSYLHNFRIYSEYQCGILVAGNSIGPFIEFSLDESSKTKVGIQNTLWGAYMFIGGDLRILKYTDRTESLIGSYVKVPFYDGYGL